MPTRANPQSRNTRANPQSRNIRGGSWYTKAIPRMNRDYCGSYCSDQLQGFRTFRNAREPMRVSP